MKFLVDTNVLLRSIQRQHPSCRMARQALTALYRGENALFIATQNVAEFWNVCTRPINVNGLGLSISSADRRIDQLEKYFTILPDSHESFKVWRRLLVDYAVMGVKVHDTRLVAAMVTFEIPKSSRLTWPILRDSPV